MANVPSDLVGSAPRSAENHKLIAFRVVSTQVAVTLAGAAAALALGGVRAGYSGLVGGVIGVLPTVYLAMRMFGAGGGHTPERMVRTIVAAEALKILLTGALFAIAFMLLDVNGLVVIGAYAATTLAYWFALAAPGPSAR
jgi:ATP synthase protein I